MIVALERNPLTNGKIVSVHTNPDEYHRVRGVRGNPDYVMSRSDLMSFAACPHRWRNSEPEDEGDTPSIRWGNLVDCLVLAPEFFARRFAVKPDTYPDSKTGEPKAWNANSHWCRDWLEENEDLICVSSEEQSDAQIAAGRLGMDEKIAPLFSHCQTQVYVTAEYHDPETEIVVPLKALLDIVPDVKSPTFGKCLADLKTARNAAHKAWGRTVFDDGLHIQAALYMDAYVAATGEDRVDWLHVIQENEPPYECGRRILSAEYVELGRMAYLHALKRYAACLKNNDWPGYDASGEINGWTIVQPEPWMIGQ